MFIFSSCLPGIGSLPGISHWVHWEKHLLGGGGSQAPNRRAVYTYSLGEPPEPSNTYPGLSANHTFSLVGGKPITSGHD